MTDPAKGPLHLDELLDRLRASRILHSVDVCGLGNALVRVSVTGERWEVEFFPNAPPEVEVFRSSGEVYDAVAIEQLFEKFADKPT